MLRGVAGSRLIAASTQTHLQFCHLLLLVPMGVSVRMSRITTVDDVYY